MGKRLRFWLCVLGALGGTSLPGCTEMVRQVVLSQGMLNGLWLQLVADWISGSLPTLI